MIQHWNCEQCNGYNDILNNRCVYCNTHTPKPDWLTNEYQANVEFKRGIFYARGFVNFDYTNLRSREGGEVTEEEKLFAQFYNHEKILVKDMDFTMLREHRELLSKICLEAKARLVAADDEMRERKSKTNKKDFLVSVENDAISTDAINAVKVRKERMTKIDKQRASLIALGMDKDIVDEMIRGMERKATEKSLKTVVFNKAVTEKAAVVVTRSEEPAKVFDPSKLKFGAKS